MDKHIIRISEAQWSIILDFLERHPSLCKTRGHNNSARGRQDTSRLWNEVTVRLNAEGSGTTKTPKEWAVYVSNYISKLKKKISDLNEDQGGTGGGPPRTSHLSDSDQRFLAILGPGFGQNEPTVRINPFPSRARPQSANASLHYVNQRSTTHQQLEMASHVTSQPLAHARDDHTYGLSGYYAGDHDVTIEVAREEVILVDRIEDASLAAPTLHPVTPPTPPTAHTPPTPRSPLTPRSSPVPPIPGNQQPAPAFPRTTRQPRYRSRPMAPIDEARRILSRVELARAAADTATAQALNLIGQHIGRGVDILERYLNGNAN